MSQIIMPDDKEILEYIKIVTEHDRYEKENNKKNENFANLQKPSASEFVRKRKSYKLHCEFFQSDKEDGVNRRDAVVVGQEGHEIAIRFYTLASCPSDTIIIYFHGGGFIVGDLDTHDDICADFCRHTDIRFCAVDYRLSPEHIYPAALHDCRDVFLQLQKDYKKIILAGDSAGALLVAQLCLMVRDEKLGNIKGQILIYAALGGDLKTGSYLTMAQAPLLTTADCHFYYQRYCGGCDFSDDAYFAPLRSDNLSDLPAAAIFAAGFDPLRDDSLRYAQKLEKSAVKVHLRIDSQLVHAYLRARNMSKLVEATFCDIASNMVRLSG